MRVLIGVPLRETMRPEVCKAIFDLDFGDDEADLEFMKGYRIDDERNWIAQIALDRGYDKLLMLDSDIIIPKDGYLKLSEPREPIVLGFYPRKNRPGESVIFTMGLADFNDENRILYSQLGTMPKRIPIKGGGMGCCLVDTDIFRQIEQPWFQTVWYGNGTGLSEDLYFCQKLRSSGITISADTTVRCGHARTDFIYS